MKLLSQVLISVMTLLLMAAGTEAKAIRKVANSTFYGTPVIINGTEAREILQRKGLLNATSFVHHLPSFALRDDGSLVMASQLGYSDYGIYDVLAIMGHDSTDLTLNITDLFLQAASLSAVPKKNSTDWNTLLATLIDGWNTLLAGFIGDSWMGYTCILMAKVYSICFVARHTLFQARKLCGAILRSPSSLEPKEGRK